MTIFNSKLLVYQVTTCPTAPRWLPGRSLPSAIRRLSAESTPHRSRGPGCSSKSCSKSLPQGLEGSLSLAFQDFYAKYSLTFKNITTCQKGWGNVEMWWTLSGRDPT